MNARLTEVVVEAPGWNTALPEIDDIAEQGARLAMSGAGLSAEGYGISVLACDDARITALNTGFRGKAGPTNVLSWPAFELRPMAPGADPSRPPPATRQHPVHLGDVAIALQTVLKEADRASIPLKDHVLHLILHGSLHLLGYDHEKDADAAIMEEMETTLLASVGVPDPYAKGDADTPHSD